MKPTLLLHTSYDMQSSSEHISDVLIIGSGAAGLSLALRLAPHCKVTVLSKGLLMGSHFYAQGGIAAVFDETDSISSHVDDTLIAGAGLCDKEAVEFIASNARSCVQWLIDQGVLLIQRPVLTVKSAITLPVKVVIATAVFCIQRMLPVKK